MEHEIPFGNSNRENGPTFLDFPLFLGIFQRDEPTNLGAYHLTENFGNSGWKVNGKVTFRKFQPKIEEYFLR